MKKLRGIILMVAVLVLCIVLLPTETQAATVVESGTCGDNVTWTLDDKGVVVISGTGSMWEYSSTGSPWRGNNINKVVIENGVTSVSAYAFSQCLFLSEVMLPDSVISIGACAFSGSNYLTDVVIPENVTVIGSSAFSHYTEISVDENNKVYSSDEKGVLFDKWKTKLISAPNTLTGTYTIPQSVIIIGDNAFAFNRYTYTLKEVIIPEGVTTIGSAAFRGCAGLTGITIPETVNSIGQYALADCSNLTSVKLPEVLTGIPNYMFYCTPITSVTFGKNVKHIGMHAFDATKLENVYYSGTSEEFAKITIDNYGDGNKKLLNAKIAYEYGACDHSYDGGAVTKEPTCGAVGIKTYTCTLCGSKKTETIEKTTTHNYNTGTVTKEPTCSADGVKVYTCTICGDEKTEYLTERPEHSYNSGVVTKEATCAETGEKTFTCFNCGANKVEHTPKETTHHYLNGICLDCGGEDPQYAEPTDEEKAEKVGGLLGAIIRLLQSILKIIFFFL